MAKFGEIATKLARNPIGVLGLFLVLMHSIITTILCFSPILQDKTVWAVFAYIGGYPLILLFVFYKLVTKHHTKLYAPGDFPRAEDFKDLAYGDQNRVLTRTESDVQSPKRLEEILVTLEG